jgi:hypothetical protein
MQSIVRMQLNVNHAFDHSLDHTFKLGEQQYSSGAREACLCAQFAAYAICGVVFSSKTYTEEERAEALEVSTECGKFLAVCGGYEWSQSARKWVPVGGQ